MTICKRCGAGPLEASASAPVYGIVCMKCRSELNEAIRPKIFYMSGPGRSREDRRSYLIRRPGEPSYLIRIFPGGKMICDCPAWKDGKQFHCGHIAAVDAADRKKFRT